MPEPQDNPGARSDGGEDVLSFVPPHLTPAERALLHPGAEATDDTPTIISKPANGVLRAEETFAQGLRGRRLAHFELIEPIGVGGMAAVIRACDTQLDRQVALKILPPEMAVDPENIRRFHQEARAAARLDHENIARVFFCGDDQGLHFIAFEFVEGENLRMLLDRRGPLPVPEAVHYLLQITLGLVHASSRGVVHRDIKPSNLIITPDGRAKLVDMGLARSLNPLGSADLTQSGVTLGTFDYISPEQALEPRDADVRSDIYSLGCTFYQIVTGQSPVPEGTAAKKLHHHQHVPPVDPRELNPAVPDELAAILSRMMAKDPRDRYQDPLHLAKHVDDLAKRLGLPSDVPDHVRTVQVPAPPPAPRSHPLLVAGVAGLLLVVLVSLHGMLSGPGSAGRRPVPDWASEPPGKFELERPILPSNDNRVAAASQETPVIPPEQAGPYRVSVKSLAELEQAVQESRRHPETVLELAGAIDLTPALGSLVFDGPGQVTLQPAEESTAGAMPAAPVLRLEYRLDARGTDGTAPWAGLTVKAGKVVMKGVHFEIDAHEADVVLAALRVREGGQLVLKDCDFIQANALANPQKGRLSAVVVDGPAALPATPERPQLEAVHCSFRHGRPLRPQAAVQPSAQDGLTLSGAANVHLTSCAFGPHRAAVHLLERATADVWMQQCSVFLLDGAAFQADDRASFTRLRVAQSIFSRPVEEAPTPGAVAAVVKCGERLAELPLLGSNNAYHNLGAFCVRGDEKLNWSQVQQRFRDARDEKAHVVTSWPWNMPRPLDALDDLQPRNAFAPLVDHPDLRLGEQLIGCQALVGHQLYDSPLPRVEERTVNVRIVDPSQEADGNRYKSLADAILASRPGDTVLINHNGPLRIEAVIEKTPLDLTVKAGEGYHPVLRLRGTRESEAVLFRVYDGELRFEKLEFLLQPRQRRFRELQSVVGVSGLGKVTFTDCVVTLDGGDEASLAVVTLADPSKVMAPDPERPSARSVPEIVVTNSFVRGRGDFLKVPASRGFDLKATNLLAALDGSFLNVGGNPVEPPADAAPGRLTLERVTTYLTGHLIQVRTAKNKLDLVPLSVASAQRCLFAAAGTQPLIHFGGEITDDQLRRLSWRGEQNAYSNYAVFLEQQVKHDEMMMGMTEPYKRPRWETFTGETNSRYDPVRFAGAPVSDAGLARAAAGVFRVPAEPGDEPGADLARLPAPWSDAGTPRVAD